MTNQPDIFIAGMRIQEPIIALTCFVVTSFSFIGFYKTRNIAYNPAFFYYRIFILLIGISSFIGAFVAHAFQDEFGIGGKFCTWFTSMMAVSMAQQAAFMRIQSRISERTYLILSFLNWVQLLTFITITIFKKEFLFVEIHTAISLLLVVCSIELWLYTKNKSRISLNIMVGIGMLIIGVMFHILKISATNWFTYFDFGHVFIGLCLFFFWISILRYHAAETLSSNAKA
ncbi:MAG TPA: hypothetical protein VK177_01345 [Flavobacteriales bacterium]|nr:hypothetical protein [Flavobacteriales bacterium]